ncbi:MAG: hypothetical protein ACYDBQ_03755 [Thermoplasmatota archaeon]
MRAPMAPLQRIVIPVRYAAWLSGDLGQSLAGTLENALAWMPEVRVTILPRAFVVEADEAPGPLLEAVHRALVGLEEAVATAYPTFHHEMGPVWTGTLQAVFAVTQEAA